MQIKLTQRRYRMPQLVVDEFYRTFLFYSCESFTTFSYFFVKPFDFNKIFSEPRVLISYYKDSNIVKGTFCTFKHS